MLKTEQTHGLETEEQAARMVAEQHSKRKLQDRLRDADTEQSVVGTPRAGTTCQNATCIKSGVHHAARSSVFRNVFETAFEEASEPAASSPRDAPPVRQQSPSSLVSQLAGQGGDTGFQPVVYDVERLHAPRRR